MSTSVMNLVYLFTAVLFILGLKAMTSVRAARLGNLVAAAGMLVAIVGILLSRRVVTYTWIIAGMGAGSAIGAVIALRVRMTAVPQMVSFFNGAGGLAAALVALSHYYLLTSLQSVASQSVTAGFTALAGWVSFVGSMIALAKLQGWIRGAPIMLSGHQVWNSLLTIIAVALLVLMGFFPRTHHLLLPLMACAAGLGAMAVLPIGGADMPVVIAMLNSLTGTAVAASGLMLGNPGLLIAGAMVGASGGILTLRMCQAMNRNFLNVLFAHFGIAAAAQSAQSKTARSGSAEDAAIAMEDASRVMIIPGYGMAVAQAQHSVKEMDDILTSRGVKVLYAIHPVAGRMPGHMNVLLAEAGILYDQLLDLDAANAELRQADVALVIGANDVTNPAAKNDPGSPIYGMPIIKADEARMVFVLKRTTGPGFAGVDNPLFYEDKTIMIFGDAKRTLSDIIAILKK